MQQSQILDSVLAVLRGHHAITSRTATEIAVQLRSALVRVLVAFEGPLDAAGTWRCTVVARFDPAARDAIVERAEARLRAWVDSAAPSAVLPSAAFGHYDRWIRATTRVRFPWEARDAVLEGLAIAAPDGRPIKAPS